MCLVQSIWEHSLLYYVFKEKVSLNLKSYKTFLWALLQQRWTSMYIEKKKFDIYDNRGCGGFPKTLLQLLKTPKHCSQELEYPLIRLGIY